MIATKFIIAILVSFLGVVASERDPKWAKRLHDVLQARDSYVEKLDNVKKDTTAQNIEEFIAILEQVSSQLTGIDNLDLSTVEIDRTLIQGLINQPEEPIVTKFFQSKNLKDNYNKRGLGFILRTLRAHYDYGCINKLLSPPQTQPAVATIPIDTMCSRVSEDLGKQDNFIFSTDKICSNTKQCSGQQTPHPYGDTDGTNVQDACKEDNRCDIGKALPKMGALLWYKISAFIARSFCSNSLGRSEKSALKTDLEEIEGMTNLILAYGSTLYWNDFFQKAVEVSAFSNLANAMALVEERKNAIGFVSLACIDLQAEDMCAVGSIYKAFESLRKIKHDRQNPPPTRNLRLYSKIDHAKMIELKSDALDHIALLGNIRRLDDNLQAAVGGISKYFHGLATYDQGIAAADVTFLKDKLVEFDGKATTLSAKLEKDIKDAMTALLAAQSAQVVEETTILGLQIAEHANLIKVIFGGVEAADIYEQTREIARSVAELASGAALMVNIKKVYEDTSDLDKYFIDNAAQISNLDKMVEAIKTNTIDEIGFDVDKFIKGYGAYTPKVDTDRLAKNDALWAAFKGSTCDLLFGAEGIGAAAAQAVVGGMLLCENLEGTLAEFAALRENIFDFQFDLVDALARVVRGNVAKKLAESITVTNDLLDASQLMLGFFMTQYRLQSHAALYCDKLEYLNQGRPVSACSSTGFFTEHELDTLTAYNPDTTYHLDERFVYIPTRPEFDGDTAYINLPSLAKGNPVTFRLPARRSWLRKYNWLARDEILAPFVESFELYLPLKEYKTGSEKRHSRTRITLNSIAGSSFSETTKVTYNVPFEHSNYITVYTEGYDRCPRDKETPNPYSLCNNLPTICDTTDRVPPITKGLMPTILSTWKISYTVETGETDLDWNAPNPATNLLLIGSVKLRNLPNPNKRRGLWRPRDETPFGCCTGNTYQPDWKNRDCVPCPSNPDSPTDSVTNLRGYYCEKGDEDVAGDPAE
ncbi:hypothetical protein OS493_036524 [Desmophyllum pertusum]|uniref:Uncharacterized protein n=1 Tax=Desmophyllum pertusum TaxID=174260 RepID=A0A9W9ZK47_9CNID|nr:hypothetical protein OS493_036524 [Desmophyllum pertusum]